jgi:hypothetical protein
MGAEIQRKKGREKRRRETEGQRKGEKRNRGANKKGEQRQRNRKNGGKTYKDRGAEREREKE